MLKEHLPTTQSRVPSSTKEEVNRKIELETQARVERYRQNRGEIHARLEELDREWDTERFLEANASSVVLISVILAFAHSPYWMILAGLVGIFLLQHAIQGWCPPLPIIRRFGYRTADEINHERTALKFLRGDFDEVCKNPYNASYAALH